MRVLHVISTLSPASGGPTQVMAALTAAQVAQGCEVTICTTDRDNPTRDKLAPESLRKLISSHVELVVFGCQMHGLLLSLAMSAWLRRRIRTFDMVHVHGLYRFPPTYAAYLARRQGVPYIIRPHGNLDPFLYKQSSRNIMLKRLYESWFDFPNLHGAGAIHYTAEEERARAAFLKLRAPSFVVPNGVDWDRFKSLPGRGAFRATHRLGDAPLVLFLGRLHFKKGFDLLIPAFDAVRRDIPDAQLVIVGPENDDFGQKVRGWVEGRGLTKVVHFVGHLDGSDVIQAYVDADVFVLPSYTENFGMTVVEAMACGLPVVISDQVNIHQDVAKSGGGVVTRCDVDEIAQALTVLLKDKNLRSSMGEKGRQFVQQRYTWSIIVDAMTREYEKVIQRSHQKNG